MEEVTELRNVLERVEGKLIAAGKIYGAMNFGVWSSIMLLYYVMLGIFDISWQFNLIYWPLGFAVAMVFTGRIWKKLKRLRRVTGREIEGSKTSGILVMVSWITGIILGWGIIPRMGVGVSEGAALAVGFLSFITLSIFGMWLVFARYSGVEREIIPSFLIPAMGIPIVWNMETGAMVWAGFTVALSFALTILWYLYSAFKAIER
ncbi:hypothetical protein [Thermococcus sp.]|uniref:hypothetical protein n=1 Tax=Thermococcus sp. TaxID=35749 RepID=UPI00263675B6|nr:hypothetical protein [Thermococcus sp.]